MSAVPADVQAFDIERALSKALGIRVETIGCSPGQFKFKVGRNWQLCLDEDQLGELWADIDNLSVLRDSFDALKGDCLAFMSYQSR